MTIKPQLQLALVQAPLVWQDAAANREAFSRMLDGVEADLVILPEMFTTGFSMQSDKLAEPQGGETTTWIKNQARALNAVVCGSVMIRAADGSFRNRLLWAEPNGSLRHYDKRHLFRMAGEHKHYAPGQEQALFMVQGWRVRPMICYDLRFPVWSRDPHGTDLLLYTANWPAARRHHWNALLPARAIENLCYCAAVNRIGEDGKGNAHAGDSQVADFEGQLVLQAGDRPGVFRVGLDHAALLAYRERFPAFHDADTFTLSRG